jgi:hypothetical protein
LLDNQAERRVRAGIAPEELGLFTEPQQFVFSQEAGVGVLGVADEDTVADVAEVGAPGTIGVPRKGSAEHGS